MFAVGAIRGTAEDKIKHVEIGLCSTTSAPRVLDSVETSADRPRESWLDMRQLCDAVTKMNILRGNSAGQRERERGRERVFRDKAAGEGWSYSCKTIQSWKKKQISLLSSRKSVNERQRASPAVAGIPFPSRHVVMPSCMQACLHFDGLCGHTIQHWSWKRQNWFLFHFFLAKKLIVCSVA